jgi:hypothetical protein
MDTQEPLQPAESPTTLPPVEPSPLVNPVEPPPPPNSPKWPLIVAGLVILLFAAIGVAGYFYLNPQQSATSDSTSPLASPSSTPDPTADWQTYSNSSLGINFQYPWEWTVDEADNQGDIIRVLKQPNQPIILLTFGQARLNKLNYDGGQRTKEPPEMPNIIVGVSSYPTQKDFFGEGIPGYGDCMLSNASTEYFVDVNHQMLATIHKLEELGCNVDGSQTIVRETTEQDIDLAKKNPLHI